MKNNSTDFAGLLSRYLPFAGVRFCIVLSADGGHVDSQNTSDSLTNVADRALLWHLRRNSDVAITSRLTAIAEALRASALTQLTVVTSNSEIAGYSAELLTVKGQGDSKKPVIFITELGSKDRLEANLNAVGSDAVIQAFNSLKPQDVITNLALLGKTRLLFESGPTMAANWIAAGVVGELAVTVTGVAIPPREMVELPEWIQSAILQSGKRLSLVHQVFF